MGGGCIFNFFWLFLKGWVTVELLCIMIFYSCVFLSLLFSSLYLVSGGRLLWFIMGFGLGGGVVLGSLDLGGGSLYFFSALF